VVDPGTSASLFFPATVGLSSLIKLTGLLGNKPSLPPSIGAAGLTIGGGTVFVLGVEVVSEVGSRLISGGEAE